MISSIFSLEITRFKHVMAMPIVDIGSFIGLIFDSSWNVALSIRPQYGAWIQINAVRIHALMPSFLEKLNRILLRQK